MSKYYEYESELEQEIFEYLDEFRESGETNMFGTRQYIQEEFGLDTYQAISYLTNWMDTFSQRHPK